MKHDEDDFMQQVEAHYKRQRERSLWWEVFEFACLVVGLGLFVWVWGQL